MFFARGEGGGGGGNGVRIMKNVSLPGVYQIKN